MRWWVVIPYIPCPFCDKKWLVSTPRIKEMTLEYLIPSHLAVHAEEGWGDIDRLANPKCSRCQRLEKAPADIPHRPCFLAECTCPCSYPAKESPVAE